MLTCLSVLAENCFLEVQMVDNTTTHLSEMYTKHKVLVSYKG